MFSKIFWISAFERMIKVFANGLLTVFVGDKAYNILSVNWPEALAIAATASLISLLMSIASSQVGNKNSPSLVSGQEEQATVEKIEAGEPVGDPEVIVEPEAIVPVEEEKPLLSAVKRKRAPRKKVGE